MHQDDAGPGQGIATELGPIDFAAVAAGLGARGVRVDDDAEFEPALAEALAADGPTVIHLAARPGLGVRRPACHRLR